MKRIAGIKLSFIAAIAALLVCGMQGAHSQTDSIEALGNAGKYGSTTPDSIKIGFIASLSGVAGKPSKDMVRGMLLYLDEVKWKMGGKPIQLIVENDGGSAATAMAKARKLIDEDKVDVIDGLHLSPCALAAAPVAEKAQIPMLIAVAGADDLTQRKQLSYVIRTGKTASQPVQPFGEYAFKTLGYKRVITLAADYPFSWESVGGFQKCFEQSGGQVIQKLWVPLGFLDFASTMQQIRKDADAIYISSVGNQAIIMLKQLRQLGVNLPIIGDAAAFDEAILEEVGEPALGAVNASVWGPTLPNAANKRFVKAYTAKYHDEDVAYYAEHGYTSGLFLDKAIQTVKGDVSNKQKLLAALKQVELKESPRGPIKLDSYNNPVENCYLRQVVRNRGRLQNKVIHTFPNVSQFWNFSPEEFLKNPVYSKTYPPCQHCK